MRLGLASTSSEISQAQKGQHCVTLRKHSHLASDVWQHKNRGHSKHNGRIFRGQWRTWLACTCMDVPMTTYVSVGIDHWRCFLKMFRLCLLLSICISVVEQWSGYFDWQMKMYEHVCVSFHSFRNRSSEWTDMSSLWFMTHTVLQDVVSGCLQHHPKLHCSGVSSEGRRGFRGVPQENDTLEPEALQSQ